MPNPNWYGNRFQWQRLFKMPRYIIQMQKWLLCLQHKCCAGGGLMAQQILVT